MTAINIVNNEELLQIIESREPRGLFLSIDDYTTACDNTTGDAWTEDFADVIDAIFWLMDCEN